MAPPKGAAGSKVYSRDQVASAEVPAGNLFQSPFSRKLRMGLPKDPVFSSWGINKLILEIGSDTGLALNVNLPGTRSPRSPQVSNTKGGSNWTSYSPGDARHGIW